MIYKLFCPEPAHFLFAKMAFLRNFLQMFVALVMYNFAFRTKSSFMCNSLDPRTLLWWKLRKNFWHFTKIEICIAITMFTVATWNCNKAYAAWLCNCFFGWFHCFHFKVICILLVCCVDWLACLLPSWNIKRGLYIVLYHQGIKISLRYDLDI